MEIKIVRRLTLDTLALATGLALPFLGQPQLSIAVMSGALWSCLNLYLIKKLAVEFVLQQGYRGFMFWILGLLKFPLLYFIGYTLLKLAQLEALYVLIGFSALLLAIVLRGGLSYAVATSYWEV